MTRLPAKTPKAALLLGGLMAALWGIQTLASESTSSNALVTESPAHRSGADGAPFGTPERASTSGSSPELATSNRIPGGNPRVDLDVLPHPPSERADHDARQHELFAAVSRALETLDFARARALLAEHERSFAADGWHERRRGFELVLGCLQHRDQRERFTADAERYLKEERISPLRRSVRRVCLEGRGFHRRT